MMKKNKTQTTQEKLELIEKHVQALLEENKALKAENKILVKRLEKFIRSIVDYVVDNMVDYLYEKIKKLLKDKEPYFQENIRNKIGKPDRAILTGYLRCLTDLGIIQSKNRGKAKIYFIKKAKGNKNE